MYLSPSLNNKMKCVPSLSDRLSLSNTLHRIQVLLHEHDIFVLFWQGNEYIVYISIFVSHAQLWRYLSSSRDKNIPILLCLQQNEITLSSSLFGSHRFHLRLTHRRYDKAISLKETRMVLSFFSIRGDISISV